MTTEQTPVVSDNENGSAEIKAINPDDHARAVKDMLKYKGQVRDLSSKMETLMGEMDGMKAKTLEDKEDYKSLYEQELNNHGATKTKLVGVSKNVVFAEKHRAVLPALRKAGFVDEAEKLLTNESLASLEFETTSEGRFIIDGVDTFVDNYKREFPFAFRASQPPKVNSGVGAVSFGDEKITPAKVIETEDLVKQGKLPPEKYKEVLLKYQQQQSK